MGRAIAHLQSLEQKHYELDLEINGAIHTRQPDHKVTEMKKEKLRIKEEIENLKKQLHK